jgi:hypothetical protein
MVIPLPGRGDPYGYETSRLPHFLANRITIGGEVVTAVRAGRPLPNGRFLVLISVKRLSRPQDHSAVGRIRSISKNPMTSSGIEPATFRLVA